MKYIKPHPENTCEIPHCPYHGITKPQTEIYVDRHAIRAAAFEPNANPLLRYGEAAGWIIVYTSPLDPQAAPHVDNKLFATEEAAVKHAKTMHASYQPYVKALRKA